MDTRDLGKALQKVAVEYRDTPDKPKGKGLPEVVVRHGEHRLSIRYEVLDVEYDVNNNRLEIVTGEQK